MVNIQKIEKFLNSNKKFFRVLHVNGLTFEGEFKEIKDTTNGRMLILKNFEDKEVGIYFDAIRDIKFQESE